MDCEKLNDAFYFSLSSAVCLHLCSRQLERQGCIFTLSETLIVNSNFQRNKLLYKGQGIL